MPLVALLTDYGLLDHYVGVVKAVIKRACSSVDVIDITHHVTPFNVQEGAFLLLKSVGYLPDGCVIMAVVDPGVATRRKAIAVVTKKRAMVGPDNGLLFPAAELEGIQSIYEISSSSYVLARPGTFAGRDVFAPAAAHLACGLPAWKLGRRLKGMKSLRLPTPRVEREKLHGTVMHVDHFRNLVTNVDAKTFDGWRQGRTEFILRGRDFSGMVYLRSSYQEMRGTSLIVGSGGEVEISRRERAPGLPLSLGDGFTLSFV